MADHGAELERILLADPLTCQALEAARDLALPDWWIVSGAIYNTVWNALTGRPSGHGLKDIDLFYFDPDTSWEAEDRTIRHAARAFAARPPVEVRNQARVHLWFERHFGYPIAPYRSCAEAIGNFAARSHSIGARLEQDGNLSLCAPYGLADIFALRIVPNTSRPNRATYEAKAARAKALWPELTVIPWPEIRAASPETDWTAVHALLAAAYAPMRGRIDPPSSLDRMTPGTLAEKAGRETVLLAFAPDLAGCVFLEARPRSLYINKLAVAPAAQGRGTGHALVQAAEAEARRHGLDALTLQTRIELTENHAAFAAMGFAKTAETCHPGFDRSTSITMEKRL